MPALITHDLFAKDVYSKQYTLIGEDNDSYQAFLLGNQGPDPMFYAFMMPLYWKFRYVAQTIHRERPTELLAAFMQSLEVLDDTERAVGKAYLMGFLGHYLLDSAAHPLVLHYQFKLSEAGVEGLDARDKHEIHNLIETEYDEVALYTRLGKTIATFNPAEKTLRANDHVLDIVSKMYVFAVLKTYGIVIPASFFAQCVRNYRLAQVGLYSKTGVKRAILGDIEELFRRHSIVRATMLRDIKLEHATFDNHEHATWKNPFTDEISTESVWDIYERMIPEAASVVELLANNALTEDELRMITKDRNFSGEPTQAEIV